MTALANWRPTSLETRDRLRWAYARAELTIAIELEKLRRQQMQEIRREEALHTKLEPNRCLPTPALTIHGARPRLIFQRGLLSP